MTTSKDLEKKIDDKFFHRAAQIWCEDEHAKKEMDAFLAMSIAKALTEAHAAGFEAGLKARMPSREEFFKWLEDFDSNYALSPYTQNKPNAADTYEWIAENMRKGDV